MTIEVTKGSLTGYDFYVMENESTSVHGGDSRTTGTLGDTVSPDHEVHGTITIDCPRTDSTVMLTHQGGLVNPISALTIKG
ncbi:hypothetical protein O6R08_03930 [Cutibacterium equinum]|uniref:Uncharacterized protein n=1 Tax=Cutibacterium equinum TaxID=3016342 RepID=A0ABY7R030_9ACTN|nr:hypothetical protein [Cutibacterium equinum]WCC80647.1 hypothetical protein O6R08_03930 [Cutibacterium equinum]